MLVKCPKCKAGFNMKNHLIRPEGVKVRCSGCKQVFKVYPPQTPIYAETAQATKTDFSGPQKPEEAYTDEGTMTMVDFSQDVFDRFDEIRERYEELGSIGSGGMGEVRVAKDTQLLRKVAIKVLKKEVNSPAALSFFIREAQITAQLDHPNIVPLYTVKPPKEGEKEVSFVMKLIRGKTLFDVISRAREILKEDPKAELPPELSLNSRLEFFLKACEGISYAHRKKVVHRDLKPANIMVGDFGEVYVMDWGIAKMLQEPENDVTSLGMELSAGTNIGGGATNAGTLSSSQPEGVVGTLSYMSPEQAKGLPFVDTASDIFSMGAVLYEIVTLKPARVGDSTQKLKWAKEGYLNTLEHLNPELKLDPELKAIINKATEFHPDDRYETINGLVEDLRKYIRGDEVSVWPDSTMRKAWRWMNRHRIISLITLLSVLLVLSGFAIGSLYLKNEAMRKARIREIRLSQLQADISSHANVIDAHFLRLEDLGQGLANTAMYLVEKAPPNNENFYWKGDFNDPGKKPVDYVFAPLYDKPVSIEYPVVALAPGVTREDVRPLMQRLAPLRYHFKKLLVDSRGAFKPLSEAEIEKLLTIEGVPIRWAFIGLKAGVMFSYPGKGTYSDEYDPRKRPWYQLAANKEGVFWGNPYVDIQGLGLVLPCAVSLYGSDSTFYGVLGMDVTFSDIIHDNLTRPGSKGVLTSYLLDNEGRIVVHSEQLGMEVKDVNAALKLEAFPVEKVVEAIKRKEPGNLIEIRNNDQSSLIVFYQMKSLGWYYVEKLDTGVILEE